MYDLVLVVRPSVSEVDRKKVLDTLLKSLGDVKTETKDLGRRNLAYPMKKEREGFYLLVNIASENPLPADLEKKLLTTDSILRHLIVRRRDNGVKKS